MSRIARPASLPAVPWPPRVQPPPLWQCEMSLPQQFEPTVSRGSDTGPTTRGLTQPSLMTHLRRMNVFTTLPAIDIIDPISNESPWNRF